MEATQTEHGVLVGDIFVASWGYDQTNIDYYEVVKVTPKSIYVQAIHSTKVADLPQHNVMAPDPGHLKEEKIKTQVNPETGDLITEYGVREPMLRRTDGQSFKVYDWGVYAHRWDGRPRAETKAQFGH